LKQVSGQKAVDAQSTLWDWVGDRPLPSQAMARPFVGDFFEEATRILMGAVRLKTDATKTCPDNQIPSGEYIECKSVGNSGNSLLYDHRIEKYDTFMAAGNRLYYVLWRHTCPATKYKTLYALREALSRAITHVMIVEASEVHTIAWECPQRFTSYSGTKKDPSKYKLKPARVLTGKVIKSWVRGEPTRVRMGAVYGYEIQEFPVFGGCATWLKTPI
jgi:hypothetical protein